MIKCLGNGSCVFSAGEDQEKISLCLNVGCGRWMVRAKTFSRSKRQPSENSSDEQQSEDEDSFCMQHKGDFVLSPEEMLYILQLHAVNWMDWKEYFSLYIENMFYWRSNIRFSPCTFSLKEGNFLSGMI